MYWGNIFGGDRCINEMMRFNLQGEKNLRCLIEHDRMLFNGSDRQHASLSGNQIDEFDFLSIDPLGWLLSKDRNRSLMIGDYVCPA